MGKHLFFDGNYENLSVNDIGGVRLLSAGLGIRFGLGAPDSDLDVYGLLTYEELDHRRTAAEGYGAELGVRWQPMSTWELKPQVGYVDYGNLEKQDTDADGLRYGIESVHAVGETVSVMLGYNMSALEFGNEDVDLNDEIRVGLRLDVD